MYFFLLVLRISLDFYLDASYKQDRFSKTLPKKSFKFVLNRKIGIIAFHLNFMLLLAKIDLLTEKQSCKRDALVFCGIGRIKIIFALLIKVIALYIQVFIV